MVLEGKANRGRRDRTGVARMKARRDRRNRPGAEGLEIRALLSAVPNPPTSEVARLIGGSLTGGTASKVSTDLLLGYNLTTNAAQTSSQQAMATQALSLLQTDALGRVAVAITTAQAVQLAPSLTALGANVVTTLPQYNRIEAYIPWSTLPAISNLGNQGLMGIVGVQKPITSAGLVTSEGVNVMQSDRVQASTPGADGTGVKVGVLSDSYNALGGAGADIASGDLPSGGVQVLQDASGSDEGRAMLQIVHDVAPGASLAFATGFGGEGNFANNITALANAGAKVITDDLTYFAEPFFQPGIVAQAVNNVVTTQGVSYYSSAGNLGTQSYDTASSSSYGASALNFTADTTYAGLFLDFDPTSAVNTRMTFTLAQNQAIILSMQWDQPFYTTSGVTTDLDIYVLDRVTGDILAGSAADNLSSQTPNEVFGFQNTGAATQFDLIIYKYDGPNPGQIKFVNFGANSYGDTDFGTFSTFSSTISPHAGIANAMAVGAVPFFDQRNPEGFSSFGPMTFLFDAAGNRLSSAVTVAKPDFVAPDGVSTTFFGGSYINGYPNFFGTSAAAPHAAGVAAQILQAKPSSTPSQIYSLLKSTADPNIGGGDPNQVGAGLIDVFTAVFGGPVPASGGVVDGFEGGALGTDWTVYTASAGRVQVSSADGPSSGSYHLVLDSNLNGYVFPHYNEAVLHVDLTGQSNVSLAFDQKYLNPYGLPVTSMPASFTGRTDATGVALSVDGTNWYRVTSLGGDSSTPYSRLTFDLSALAAANGLTLGANTLIKFQEYSDVSLFAPELALALDNVSVTALSALATETIDNGTAQRSAVRSLTLTFQGNVTTIPSSAFNLKRASDGLIVPVVVGTPVYSGGITTVVLTFGGSSLNGTSLSDGRYTLTIDGSKILDSFGNPVDAAKNGTAGSTGTVSFFRFFGDSNGDGLVDARDYLAFRAAYLSGNVTTANSIYDYNGDGFFTVLDLNMFTTNFTKRKLV